MLLCVDESIPFWNMPATVIVKPITGSCLKVCLRVLCPLYHHRRGQWISAATRDCGKINVTTRKSVPPTKYLDTDLYTEFNTQGSANQCGFLLQFLLSFPPEGHAVHWPSPIRWPMPNTIARASQPPNRTRKAPRIGCAPPRQAPSVPKMILRKG